jgi:UDP-glucuronate 4-epimerase
VKEQSMRVLVTGAAGFIGMHTSLRLLERGDEVIGFDNLNAYYDPSLKDARLARLLEHPGFTFVRGSLEDRAAVDAVFAAHRPERVVNLAAQAGVRYSIEDPRSYVDSNLVGFINILEGSRHHEVEHLVYASSSSVYGANTKLPFSVADAVDHPVSLYAASKKANELMAHTYSHLFRLPTTGLRFFTVYGPWGRPDMALFLFTKAILAGEPIRIFNHGKMRRDFTYVDDIVEGVVRVLDQPAAPDASFDSDDPNPATSTAPYRVYNIGNDQPTELLHYVDVLEQALGVPAIRQFEDIQPGDVPATWADVDALRDAVGFAPSTPVEEGVKRFVAWYRAFYGIDGMIGRLEKDRRVLAAVGGGIGVVAAASALLALLGSVAAALALAVLLIGAVAGLLLLIVRRLRFTVDRLRLIHPGAVPAGRVATIHVNPQEALRRAVPARDLDAATRVPSERVPFDAQHNRLWWFVPGFGYGSGGHANILTMVSELEQLGIASTVVISDPIEPERLVQMRDLMAANYVPVLAPVVRRQDVASRAGDVLLATDWRSVRAVLEDRGERRAHYFVQDHEVEFAATGAMSALAADTYRAGLSVVTLSGGLA